MKDEKEKKSKKDDKGLRAFYVELESPLDLARHTFGQGMGGHIKAIKENGKYMLMSAGERIGHARFMYFTTMDKISNFFVYNPGSDSPESFEIREKANHEADYKSYKAPIMELMTNPYEKTTEFKKEDVVKIRTGSVESLIKSLASMMHEEEHIPRVYAFFNGSEHIIGTFDLFHEGSTKIFTYATIGAKQKFGALSYNYNTDAIEPVNSFQEKMVVYISVVNLKKPFPFF